MARSLSWFDDERLLSAFGEAGVAADALPPTRRADKWGLAGKISRSTSSAAPIARGAAQGSRESGNRSGRPMAARVGPLYKDDIPRRGLRAESPKVKPPRGSAPRPVLPVFVPHELSFSGRLGEFLRFGIELASGSGAFIADSQGLAIASVGESEAYAAVTAALQSTLAHLGNKATGTQTNSIELNLDGGNILAVRWSQTPFGPMALGLVVARHVDASILVHLAAQLRILIEKENTNDKSQP